MGFYSGRATFARYRVDGPAPRMFTEEHLARLAEHAAGRSRMLSGDGVEAGWAAGDHVLDTDFDFAKNVINDSSSSPCGWTRSSSRATCSGPTTPSTWRPWPRTTRAATPSSCQKREAKESARDRLEAGGQGRPLPEAQDASRSSGTGKSNELLFGTTSVTQIDRLLVLFKQTFGHGFEAITAGRRAYAPGRTAQPHPERGRRVARRRSFPAYPRPTWSGSRTRPAGTSSATSSSCGSGTSATSESATFKLLDGSEVDGVHGPDADAGMPAGHDRARDDHPRGPDPAAGGHAGDPGREAAAEVRADAGPARRAVRVHPARRDAGGRGGQDPAARRRKTTGPGWRRGPNRSATWWRRWTCCSTRSGRCGSRPSGRSNSPRCSGG